jgi:hypothetical protein
VKFFTQLAERHNGNRLESLLVGALQRFGCCAGAKPRGQAFMMI